MIGKVLRNLRLVLQHMLSVRELHVSLPRCLRLWHCPLHLFLGGVRPDALSLPGSKPLCPPHHLPAVALHHVRKKESKNHYLHYISALFSCVPASVKYVSLLNCRQIFSSLEKKNSREVCSKSCDMSQDCIWPDVNFDIPQCFS